MADSTLDATAARFLFHFACARAANVVYEWRAQNAGDSVLGDDAAQLMGGDSQQRQIKQTESLRQTILFHCHARQHGHARNIKPKQARVLGEQLFVAFLLFSRLGAVLLDGKIAIVLALRRS